MPSQVHEETIRFWDQDVMAALSRLTPTQQSPPPGCVGVGSTTFLLGMNNKEADGGVRSTTSNHPSIVLEVGVSESLGKLKRDAIRWLEHMAEVQAVILVKIYPPRLQVHPTHPVIKVQLWKNRPLVQTTRSAQLAAQASVPQMVWCANWTINATPLYILLSDIFGPHPPAAYGTNDRIYLNTGGWRQRIIDSY